MAPGMSVNGAMSAAIPAESAAERLTELVRQVARDHDHVVLTSEEAAAVLIGVDDVETLEVLSDSQLMDDIRASLKEIAAGETYPIEEIYPDAVPGPSTKRARRWLDALAEDIRAAVIESITGPIAENPRRIGHAL